MGRHPKPSSSCAVVKSAIREVVLLIHSVTNVSLVKKYIMYCYSIETTTNTRIVWADFFDPSGIMRSTVGAIASVAKWMQIYSLITSRTRSSFSNYKTNVLIQFNSNYIEFEVFCHPKILQKNRSALFGNSLNKKEDKNSAIFI